MSTGIDYPLTFAEAHARKYLGEVARFCERAEVVGSIRRRKPVVHDIEFIVIAKTAPITGLFGEMGHTSLLQAAWPDLVRAWGAKTVKDGEKYKKVLLTEGLHLEINISTPERWGVEMVIKTGPADFSHKCVTPRVQGGHLPSWARIADGWRVYNGNGQPIAMPTETQFLDFLGLGWIEPEER